MTEVVVNVLLILITVISSALFSASHQKQLVTLLYYIKKGVNNKLVGMQF